MSAANPIASAEKNAAHAINLSVFVGIFIFGCALKPTQKRLWIFACVFKYEPPTGDFPSGVENIDPAFGGFLLNDVVGFHCLFLVL